MHTAKKRLILGGVPANPKLEENDPVTETMVPRRKVVMKPAEVLAKEPAPAGRSDEKPPVRRKKLKFDESHVRTTTYLEVELNQTVRRLCEEEGESMARFINEAIRKYISSRKT